MQVKLKDIANVIRSKNAGPFELTLDVLLKEREMFEKMQSLPIKYFDTHLHGDIMSHYTNDVDTLSQMISRSLPQFISSVITIVSVFFAMIYLSWQLTIVAMISLREYFNAFKEQFMKDIEIKMEDFKQSLKNLLADIIK